MYTAAIVVINKLIRVRRFIGAVDVAFTLKVPNMLLGWIVHLYVQVPDVLAVKVGIVTTWAPVSVLSILYGDSGAKVKV